MRQNNAPNPHGDEPMTIAQQAAARNRKPLSPATGSCPWLCQLTDAHAGVLVIETESQGTPVSESYLVEPIRHGATLAGYSLKKLTGKDTGEVYHLDLTDPYGWRCSCPDALYRPERAYSCK